MNSVDAAIAAVRQELAPDSRTAVFDIRHERRGGDVVVTGQATEAAAVDALIARVSQASALDGRVIDQVVRLPDPALGGRRFALVRAPLAPVLAGPEVLAAQVSQYVMGHRLDLLLRDGSWYRVRGEDAYIGWVHRGYLEIGEAAWALTWERGEDGEPAVSLGAELVDDEDRTLVRLPWGARLTGDTPTRYRLPDGRSGTVASGEIVATDRMRDRFPPRRESIARTARRFLGSPYVWGGVTPWGVDCSGLVQSVFWMHGVAMPRDSDMQARIGAPVDAGAGFKALLPGDLVFFAENAGRINHVAISLGGPRIIHAALSNGGVAVNDLTGQGAVDTMLASIFVEARRLLADDPADTADRRRTRQGSRKD